MIPSAGAKIYVSKLKIDGIRGFDGRRSVNLDFARPDGSYAGWTVLAGRNGSGKTTMLQAIALALAGENFIRDPEVWNGQRLGDMPHRRKQLPRQFDPAVNRTIELIIVVWLDGNVITAAFEIESTTSIYSGLLRMSDLLAQQPNIAIPLFLVAPEDRREKVIEQVNRPTFERMSQPLAEYESATCRSVPVYSCRYIRFEGLREALKTVQDFITFLKPDWLESVSKSCALQDV